MQEEEKKAVPWHAKAVRGKEAELRRGGGCKTSGVGGSLPVFVPTRSISDCIFCEFYIGLRVLGDHYICKKSTV